MPTLAPGKQRHPPAIARLIPGCEATSSMEMGCGVHEPCGMKAESNAQEYTPQEKAYSTPDSSGKSSHQQQPNPQNGQRDPMVFAQPDVHAVFGEIGSVMGEGLSLSIERTACDDPAHVRPPGALPWSVGIAKVIAVLMMNAMRGYPGDRTSFQGQSAADSQEVFDGFRHLVAAVHQKAMITHADTAIDSENIKHCRDNQVGPAEKEQRCNSAQMEDGHKDRGSPNHT